MHGEVPPGEFLQVNIELGMEDIWIKETVECYGPCYMNEG